MPDRVSLLLDTPHHPPEDREWWCEVLPDGHERPVSMFMIQAPDRAAAEGQLRAIGRALSEAPIEEGMVNWPNWTSSQDEEPF